MLEYNLLADIYTTGVHEDHLFTGAHLEFSCRAPRIIEEIRESKAEVICLTEVDHFDDFYRPQLENLGYSLHAEWRKGQDAVVLGFKTDVFEVTEVVKVQHDELAAPFVEAFKKT